MKKISLSLLLVLSAIFPSDLRSAEAAPLSSEENVSFIIDRSFLKQPGMEKLLQVYATEALQKSKKELSFEDIKVKFYAALQSPQVLAQLSQPYLNQFSDEEIQRLREIWEDQTFQKYSQQSLAIMKANHQTIKELLGNLISSESQAEKATIASEEAPIVVITKDNYTKEIDESEVPVILDVYAKWCTPCKAMAPIFAALAHEHRIEVKFAKLDVDEQKAIANKLRIDTLPTFVFFRNGKEVNRVVGHQSKDDMEQLIRDLLELPPTSPQASS